MDLTDYKNELNSINKQQPSNPLLSDGAVLDVINRTITIPPTLTEVVVEGDTNSRKLTFKIQRFFDGVDLSEKVIRIKYMNTYMESGYGSAANLQLDSDTFTFDWIINSEAITKQGKLSISIEFYQNNSLGKKIYVWQTKPAEFNIEESIAVIGNAVPADYSLHKRFYEANKDPVTYNEIIDTEAPISITGRRILMPAISDLVVSKDALSQIVSFTLPRFFDGTDLSKKVISIKYINASGNGDRSRGINAVIADDSITFGWLIDSKVTLTDGYVQFAIEFLGYNEKNEFYVWQTVPAQLKVERGLDVDSIIVAPTPSWIQSWELEVEKIYDDMQSQIDGSEENAKAAKLSAEKALASEVASALSETNSKLSETNSKASEDEAKKQVGLSTASADKSKASEAAAALSETNTKASEIAGGISAVAAKASETASKLSEVNSKASEIASKASEDISSDNVEKTEINVSEASAFAENASNSAVAAKASEAASKLSETNSKASAVASKTSEDISSDNVGKTETNVGEASVFAQNASNCAVAAKASEEAAKLSENNSKASEIASKASEDISSDNVGKTEANASEASTYAQNANNSVIAAKLSETNSSVSETNASAFATTASEKAASATTEANRAKSEADRASSIVGNLGWFESGLALNTTHPTAFNGAFATVGETDSIWVWDDDTSKWLDSQNKGSGDYNTSINKPQINGITLVGDKSSSELNLATLNANGKVAFEQLSLEYATTDEAVSGTENTKLMTPLRVEENVNHAITAVNSTISVLDTRVAANAAAIGTIHTAKADKTEIPTKTSQLTNDSDFAKASEISSVTFVRW